jgi:hypothetical protein
MAVECALPRRAERNSSADGRFSLAKNADMAEFGTERNRGRCSDRAPNLDIDWTVGVFAADFLDSIYESRQRPDRLSGRSAGVSVVTFF